MSAAPFSSADVLRIDAAREVERIEAAIREQVFRQLRRKGTVVAMSGGIDSSVVAALCARALGKDRVLGLLMPERDSSQDSLRLGRLVADALGIRTALEDIGPGLEAIGCYQRRDSAIRTVLPEYGEGYKCKIALASPPEGAVYPFYSVLVQSPAGQIHTKRLTADATLGIVAATNFKQRTRKMLEYYYADRLQYAVAGTPNRLEYELGFFVKQGDGAADLKPIAHLYKTQVYRLAEHLKIPDEVSLRRPTTDTYSLEQSQEEFYFSIPLEKMDLCLYGKNHGMAATEVAKATALDEKTVARIYALIDSRRKETRPLHFKPLLVEPIGGVES